MAQKFASLAEFMKRLAPPPKHDVRGRHGRFKPKPRPESHERA